MKQNQESRGQKEALRALEPVLRREFWSSDDDALHSREHIAAVLHNTVDNMESLAIKGGGPPYIRIGRRALYVKRDVLQWIAANGRRVSSTAELQEARA